MKKYLEALSRYAAKNPSLRMGQCMWNSLGVGQDARSEIVGTDKDPYYNDANIPTFLLYLEQKFSEEGV